jgi:hypothetical protein
MLLHDIPREITIPNIEYRYMVAAVGFMYNDGRNYPPRTDYKLKVQVESNEVSRLGWVFMREGGTSNIREGWFNDDDISYWLRNSTAFPDIFNWSLVERIDRI